jgi:hypothetical protein
MLAAPGAPPRDQRHHDAHGGQVRGEARGERQRRVRGPLPVPACRLLTGPWRAVGRRGGDDALIAAQAGARIVGGEAGQRARDEGRALLPDHVEVEPEPGQRSRPEVFDHHVRGGGEAARGGEVARPPQVQDRPALAPVEERVRDTGHARAAGRVDVDDVGALVGEQHGCQRPGHVLAEVDNPEACQRTRHFHTLLDVASPDDLRGTEPLMEAPGPPMEQAAKIRSCLDGAASLPEDRIEEAARWTRLPLTPLMP